MFELWIVEYSYGTFLPKLFKTLLFILYLEEGMATSEIRVGDIPVPIVNYIYLIKYRKAPYYDIVQHILKDMEIRYKTAGRGFETIYTINPRILQEEIEKKVKSNKLTTVNICRTVLALMYGSKLRREDDFYVTTTSRGRKNYHIKVNTHTLKSMHGFV